MPIRGFKYKFLSTLILLLNCDKCVCCWLVRLLNQASVQMAGPSCFFMLLWGLKYVFIFMFFAMTWSSIMHNISYLFQSFSFRWPLEIASASHSSIFSCFDSSFLRCQWGKGSQAGWTTWGWQLRLFIMWGTIAHLESQPELVFSLIQHSRPELIIYIHMWAGSKCKTC